MHRVAACQQDGLEMVPLGRVSPQCHARPTSTEQGDDTGQPQVDEQREPSPSSQHSCCLVGKSDSRAPDDDDDSGEPSSSSSSSTSSSAPKKMRLKGRTLPQSQTAAAFEPSSDYLRKSFISLPSLLMLMLMLMVIVPKITIILNVSKKVRTVSLIITRSFRYIF